MIYVFPCHLINSIKLFFHAAFFMTLYMLCGAVIFMLLERDKELHDRQAYYQQLKSFIENNPLVNRTELGLLLTRSFACNLHIRLMNKLMPWGQWLPSRNYESPIPFNTDQN